MQQIKTFLGIGESAGDAVSQAEEAANKWIERERVNVTQMHTTATAFVTDDDVNITEAHTFTITLLFSTVEF